MNTADFIPLKQLCMHYKVEISFFSNLCEIGLIEIITIEQDQYIHHDQISDVEKMIGMYHELDVNIEGIDIVFNLLRKIDDLQNEILFVKNRLRLYENDF
ncbi:chaperone modulator CbpM [Ancylomarina sp.]|uniref:chaperone modulator CbpM n=1 Tax=Ancylomarina sp. TaxID=1970196 RepID=UPI003569253E